MYKLTLLARDFEPLARVAGCCGSLDVPYWDDAWRQLAAALLADELSPGEQQADLEIACKTIVEKAVPEEGDPHPQRATFRARVSRADFVTPGGVNFSFGYSRMNAAFILEIAFNRESVTLSCDMLTELAMNYCREDRVEIYPDDSREEGKEPVNLFEAFARAARAYADKWASVNA